MVTGRQRSIRPSSLDLEPALLIAFAGRAWQSLAGLGTIYFIIEYFTSETQGYYQTFLSLIALQSFLELGILVAIVSVVSHEWAGLSTGRRREVIGDAEVRARLASATRFVTIWFGTAAALLLVIGGTVGYVILSGHGDPSDWRAPWLGAITVASGFLWCQGLIAVLEGCNQVYQVAWYRLLQGVVSALVLWLSVWSGAGLWSLVALNATNLIFALGFLFFVYHDFFRSLFSDRRQSTFAWRRDIWPMQWPLALQGMMTYFTFSLFVPVLYSYHGVVEAGRMGMSIQVISALIGIATTWLTVKSPQMGTMFARREYRIFEATWLRASAMSVTLMFAGAIFAGSLLWTANAYSLAPADRFLDPAAFSLLLLWGILLQLIQCFATYWRAQRREPVGFWGIVPGAVTGLAVWGLGRFYGAAGAASGALAVSALVTLPLGLYFFFRSRAEVRAAAALTEAKPFDVAASEGLKG